MKTSTKLAVAFVAMTSLAGATGAALSAQADSRWQERPGGEPQQMQQAHSGGHGMHGRHHDGRRTGRHGKGGRHLARMLESFDSNDDGRLTQVEIDAARGERFSAFDADGSQTLTLEEYEKLWLDAMREVMVDRFQHLDADGDAQITAEEFKKPFSMVVRRMDRNEDGAVDREDLRRRPHRGGERDDDNG